IGRGAARFRARGRSDADFHRQREPVVLPVGLFRHCRPLSRPRGQGRRRARGHRADPVELRAGRAHGGFHRPLPGQVYRIDGNTMTGTDEPRDEVVEKELEGVPDGRLDGGELAKDEAKVDDALASLRADLEKAQQDMLYARAEVQNVRRRMEKEVADARAYAATGFARDILSVADNLARALDHVTDEMREDEKLKGFLAGIEATQRELEKVFGLHGITRLGSRGLPLDPNKHRAMLEVTTDEAEPGSVVQEMQSGYMIKDRLLRPAMVAVAKKPD